MQIHTLKIALFLIKETELCFIKQSVFLGFNSLILLKKL